MSLRGLAAVITLIPVVAVLITIGTLLRNRAPLLEPPGLMERLGVYLGDNRIETAPDARFPELRSRVYPLSDAEAAAAALDVLESLDWRRNSDHPQRPGRIQAAVRSPLLGFTDDIVIILTPVETGAATRIDMRAASRIGRGDLAANQSHWQRFIEVFEQRVGPPLD